MIQCTTNTKYPQIQIEIIKYDDIYEFEYYWDETSSVTLEEIFNNAYLVGSPSENIDCMFNHSTEGAFTICKTDKYLVQSIILINIKNISVIIN